MADVAHAVGIKARCDLARCQARVGLVRRLGVPGQRRRALGPVLALQIPVAEALERLRATGAVDRGRLEVGHRLVAPLEGHEEIGGAKVQPPCLLAPCQREQPEGRREALGRVVQAFGAAQHPLERCRRRLSARGNLEMRERFGLLSSGFAGLREPDGDRVDRRGSGIARELSVDLEVEATAGEEQLGQAVGGALGLGVVLERPLEGELGAVEIAEQVAGELARFGPKARRLYVRPASGALLDERDQLGALPGGP